MDNQKAIEILMDIQSDWECGEEYDAFTQAIDALERQIPKIVIKHRLNRCTCPTCYRDVNYQILLGQMVRICPSCGQRLEV